MRLSPAVASCVLASIVAVATGLGASTQGAPARLQIVIVVDGLRPDQVTRAQMPRLDAIAARGVEFTAHHAVFPTVTRVNAATFVTGAWPARHGLLGNTIYIPSADRLRPIDTGDHETLLKVAAAEKQLLTAPTLGQLLGRAGKRLLVVSSGSSGSALLLSPTADAGVILQTGFTRPDTWRAKAEALLGPPPEAGLPNAARNRHATDLLLRIGLPEVKPDVVFIWYSDPDTTAHARGLDAAETRAALAAVDGEIGRIEDWLRDQGRLTATNLLVTSDHGFSTHSGGFDLPAAVKPFVRKMPDGTPDIVTAGGAVHFRSGPDDVRATAIVEALQKQPAVGAIFTRARTPGDPTGHVLGTLSLRPHRLGPPARRRDPRLRRVERGHRSGSARLRHQFGHRRTRQHEPLRGEEHAGGSRPRLPRVVREHGGHRQRGHHTNGAAAGRRDRRGGEVRRTGDRRSAAHGQAASAAAAWRHRRAIARRRHLHRSAHHHRGQRALLRFRQGDPPDAAVRPLRPQTRNSSARHCLTIFLMAAR